MREFKADKIRQGLVVTERHLEFGDFRRVERALEVEPIGRYIVGLDDAGAHVRVDWDRSRNASTAWLAGREVAVELDSRNGSWRLYEDGELIRNGPSDLGGYQYENRARAEVVAEWRAGRP